MFKTFLVIILNLFLYCDASSPTNKKFISHKNLLKINCDLINTPINDEVLDDTRLKILNKCKISNDVVKCCYSLQEGANIEKQWNDENIQSTAADREERFKKAYEKFQNKIQKKTINENSISKRLPPVGKQLANWTIAGLHLILTFRSGRNGGGAGGGVGNTPANSVVYSDVSDMSLESVQEGGEAQSDLYRGSDNRVWQIIVRVEHTQGSHTITEFNQRTAVQHGAQDLFVNFMNDHDDVSQYVGELEVESENDIEWYTITISILLNN
ncbi:hypothetical protein HDV06_006564 [Boothiomyces sp. JEL0866]|nr:hypothetical protein HDV06_006564 [Boothiomyces sp. JEL0866]